MMHSVGTARPWIIFGGCVLIVFVLDWAEPVLLPIAVALLFTFLLNPPVNARQRWLRRGPAVLIVVTISFVLLTLLGWGLTRQISSLAADLPSYRPEHPSEDRGHSRRKPRRSRREGSDDA